MTLSLPNRNVNSTTASPTASWHVGITPIFPSSLLLSDNAAIESLLSDIPFLAVGLLAFAVLTFLLIVRKFDAKSTPLFLSSLLAFIAVVLDIDQLLVQSSPGLSNTSKSSDTSTLNDGLTVPLSSILPLLISREVLLGIAIGMRFLYYWVYLWCLSAGIGASSSNRKNTGSDFGEPNFLTLQNSPSPDFLRTFSDNSTSRHLSNFLVVPKYAILVATAAIPVLQLLWRLAKKFNRRGAIYYANSIIEIVVSAVVILALLIVIVVDVAVVAGHVWWSWNKLEKWKRLKTYSPVLFSLCVELASSIGNLFCFEFSESSLGRLLQALELYVLILNILVSTFYKKEQTERSSFEPSDVEEGEIPSLAEKVPVSGGIFGAQVDTSEDLFPTLASPLPPRFSRHDSVGSGLFSVRTNRDNDTDDNNTGILSMSGSSIFSESKGRISSWLSRKRLSTKTTKSMSALLGGVGGQIRSVSWGMLNNSVEDGKLQGGVSKTADMENGTSTKGHSDPNRTELDGDLQFHAASRSPPLKIQSPFLIGRMERLAFQPVLSFPLSEEKEGSVLDVIPPSSVDRMAKTFPALPSQPEVVLDNGFHLTPITSYVPDLHRLSLPYYDPDFPDPISYSPGFSSLHTKSNRCSLSHSITEIELFLRQQRAELENSFAELKLLEESHTRGLDINYMARRGSMTSDFSFSKFPEPPKNLGQLLDTHGGEGSRLSSEANRVSLGDFSHHRTALSFPSPVARTSGDSSVLGVNEAVLTLGVGLTTDTDVTNSRQLDVTSFIAAGGNTAESFASPRFRPAATVMSTLSRSSISDTEGADGVDTPPPPVVRFATKVHVPLVTPVSAIVSQSSGLRNSDGMSTLDDERGLGRSTEAETTANLTGAPAVPGQSYILNNDRHRKRMGVGIGLPSSVKLKAGNPPLPPTRYPATGRSSGALSVNV